MIGRPGGELWLHPLAYTPPLLTALVRAGWNTIFIDLERHDLTDEEIELALSAVREAGGRAVMRCAGPSVAAARRCADMGAERVVVPLVESADQLQSIGAQVNAELIPLVETRSGIASIEAIAALDGVRIVMFGPYDLAADLGIFPWPNVLENLLPVVLPAFSVARRNGKKVGFHVLTEWAAVMPFDEIDVISCSVDDVACPLSSGFPRRFHTH